MIQQRGLSLVPCVPADEGVRSGRFDIDQFRTMYDSHATDCYRVARLVVRDSRLAEDVVQDVFTAIWQGFARFDPDRGSARAWLLMVTHHKAVDLVRRNQRHKGPALTDVHLERLRAADDVEAEVVRAAGGTQVASALAKLTDVQRQVITLAYFGGYSQTEIAQLTGSALGTVKTRTLHALRHLRGNIDLAALATDEGWLRPAALEAV
jgi:RNA polymerase sigma factor (sigma-70 family)